jgi:hypothetical protein
MNALGLGIVVALSALVPSLLYRRTVPEIRAECGKGIAISVLLAADTAMAACSVASAFLQAPLLALVAWGTLLLLNVSSAPIV